MKPALSGALCLLALAGCSGSPAAPSSGSSASAAASKPAALKPLTAAYVTIGANSLPTWTAFERGYYKDAGLDAKLSYVEGSTVAIPALTNGEVQVAETTPVSSLQAQIAGQDTVILGEHIQYTTVHVMVTGDVKSLEDLRGKTVGLTKPGGSDDVVIHAILKREGFTPGKDVQLSYLGTQPAELSALQAGLIQAVMAPAPFNFAAEKAGARDLIGEHFPYPAAGVVSTRKTVKEKPDEIVGYLSSYVRAIRTIKADRKGTEDILSKYTKQTDQSVLDSSYDDFTADLVSSPAPDLDSIAGALPLLPNGEGKKAADFVDSGPIAKALAQVGS